MKITTQEYDALLEHAQETINQFLDLLENLQERDIQLNQTAKDLVAKADDWLKWLNGELRDDEIVDKFSFAPTLYQVIDCTNPIFAHYAWCEEHHNEKSNP